MSGLTAPPKILHDMKLSGEALSAKLESELGAGSVESNPRSLASYTVDGKVPTFLCLPNTPQQVGSILRICAEAQASVIPWGGGTSIRLGNIPRQTDVVIGLEKLVKLIEHDDANLTASAQAGMKVETLQAALQERGQFLAVDPPRPGEATIGGMVAANTNGPRRMFYGGVRDLVIGMKMVLPSGVQIKAGGKVVKNVAGYDLCKLFVGSLGTLGVITEVTFKMAPLPESTATFVACGPLAQAFELVSELSRSALLPTAIAILSADVAAATGIDLKMPAVAVWNEGFHEAVSRHLRDLQGMADGIGLNSRIFRDEAERRLWGEIRDFGAEGGSALYRLVTPLASVQSVVSTVDGWCASEERAIYIAHAGSGTIWVSLPATPLAGAWFSKLAALALEHRGHAVLTGAPPGLKEGIDVWGPAPASLSIMRALKREFDPQGILNPGRFIANL